MTATPHAVPNLASASATPGTLRLNVGCGRNIRAGWINLDSADLPGVDIRHDLERCAAEPIPLEDDSVDEILLSHVLEHIRDSLGLMNELYRIAKPGAVCTIRVPHGSSDDAWTDPTHVRPYFAGSFGYFSQPFYWRAHYGYGGDWRTDKIVLTIPKKRVEGATREQLVHAIQHGRNAVTEMVATLVAVKPKRLPLAELQTAPALELSVI